MPEEIQFPECLDLIDGEQRIRRGSGGGQAVVSVALANLLTILIFHF